MIIPAAIPVPPFYCPIPPESAPDADRITAATATWVGTFGTPLAGAQRAYLARMDIGRFACLTIPDGPTERRQIYSDLVFWLFAFDDAVADESTGTLPREVAGLLLRLSRCLDLPPTAYPSDGPWLVSALCDILRRLAAHTGPADIAAVADGLRSYVLTVVLAMARSGPRPPSLDDYAMIRLGDGAMHAVLRMIPIVGGYRVDTTDPRVRACEEMTNFLAGWDNDIFGHNKETFRIAWYGYPDTPSALTVLAAERGCPVDDAVPVAMAYRDRILCRFLRLRDRLRGTDPALDRYLTALGQWIRGYLEWALATDRFTDPRNPADDIAVDSFPMPAGWADEPVDDATDPLPIPTITWWWD